VQPDLLGAVADDEDCSRDVDRYTREIPVSARMGSTKTEKTNDCPGPEQNVAIVATRTTAQP